LNNLSEECLPQICRRQLISNPRPTPPQKSDHVKPHIARNNHTTSPPPLSSLYSPLLFTMPYPVLRKITDTNQKVGTHHSPPPKFRKMNNYSLPSSPTTPPYSPGTPALTPPCNKEPILQDTLHGYALNTDPTQNSLFDEQTASVMCRHYNRLTTPAFHWPRMHQCHMWHMNNKYFDKTPGGTKSAVMTAMAAMITVMGKTNETVSKMHSCEIKSPIIKATFSRQSYFRTEAIQHIGTAISFYSHDEREKMYYDRALARHPMYK